MTADRTQTPCPDKKKNRREKNSKSPTLSGEIEAIHKKNNFDIGPLIREGTIKTQWNAEKIQQDFLWAVRPGTTRQITKSEHRIVPDKIKVDKLLKLYNRY